MEMVEDRTVAVDKGKAAGIIVDVVKGSQIGEVKIHLTIGTRGNDNDIIIADEVEVVREDVVEAN